MAEQVTSLAQLVKLAEEKRSVIANYPPPFKTPKSAAFILYMQAMMVYRMIDSGMYVYEPEGKK